MTTDSRPTGPASHVGSTDHGATGELLRSVVRHLPAFLGGRVAFKDLMGDVGPGARRALLANMHRFYPPYIGAGVRVTQIAPDFTSLSVEMPLTALNRNFHGTHFGGSLYAMCDPFFMFLVLEQLGHDYVVWDKAASIRFRKPGRGRVTARFDVPLERIAEIRAEVDRAGKAEPVFTVVVTHDDGEIVAEVEKRLWVKKH
jgi:acyl-coenzyme A thioesterase PaaI-like protein